MGVIKQGIAVLSLLAMTGCAMKSDLEAVQRDMEELKGRHLTIEKDFGGFKSETREGVERTLKEYQKEFDALRKVSSELQADYRSKMESLRKGTADLQAALDAAKVDMQVLAGKVDDANLLAKKPADDLSLLKEDLERRLTAMDGRTGKLEKELEEVRKKMAEAPPAKQAELSPEALYQQGLETYRGGNPQKAREFFVRFIERYPNHELAANAHYWTGETYYAEKQYEQAILEFEKVIKNYPGREKVPSAMLKQAMAFKELGDATSARYVLKKLLDDFPHAGEAALAKTKLKELK
jgi:tol-pal system protein YbgF